MLLLLLLLQMHTNEIKLGSFPYSLYSNKRTLQDSLLVLTDLYFFLCDSIANKILAFPCEGVLKKKKKPTCWDLEIFEVSLSNPTSVSSALLSFPHHLFSLTTHANPFFFYRLLSFYFVSHFSVSPLRLFLNSFFFLLPLVGFKPNPLVPQTFSFVSIFTLFVSLPEKSWPSKYFHCLGLR